MRIVHITLHMIILKCIFFCDIVNFLSIDKCLNYEFIIVTIVSFFVTKYYII